MIKDINVRFFTTAIDNENEFDLCEITERCFTGLSNKKFSVIEYERDSISENGARQILLTVICGEIPQMSDLEIIE